MTKTSATDLHRPTQTRFTNGLSLWKSVRAVPDLRSFGRVCGKGVLYFGLALFLAAPAFAQRTAEEYRQEDVERQEEMKRTERITASALRAKQDKLGWVFDYGGNMGFTYTSSDETDRNAATQDSQDHDWNNQLTVYSLFNSLDGNWKIYNRLITSYKKNAKLGHAALDGHDFQNPTFDVLYAERQFKSKKFKHTLTLGRQFMKVGRGIAFGITADGLSWVTKGNRATASFLLLRQKPGDNNIDSLSPGSGRTKRMFAGAEYKFKFMKELTAGVYALHNLDRNTTNPGGTGQIHQFDSQYYGFGLEGRLFSKAQYWSEYIVGRGKTYAAIAGAVNTEVNVRSDAFDLGARYLFGGDLSPTVYGEFAFGSGDADRGANVTSSLNGSSYGDDSVFRSFGGLAMGYALAPSLSNIRIMKFGGSVKPFGRKNSPRWSDMTFQATYYTYSTDAPGGGTSDPALNAASTSDDIGDEIDGSLTWKLFDDVNYQLRVGVFNPGAAYANKAKEEYLRLKVSFDI